MKSRTVWALGSLGIALASAAVTFSGKTAPGAELGDSAWALDSLTFSEHVAPILFAECASCHRPGGSAPFELLTYQAVESRVPLILDAVERRRMPPWVPEPGFVDLVGERILTEDQIRTIRRWADQGALEGDPADLPPAPTWAEGWALGEPDLVVELESYDVPAQGSERYRNLVAAVPLSEARYVSSVELRFGRTRAVHHARMMIDATPSSRAHDEVDPEPGFDGMEIVTDARNPPGHFIGWAPGRVQTAGRDDIAWMLEPGTDLVLQLHLRPTGSRERVEPHVGLHFAETPPVRASALVMLGSFDIDIPPAQSDYLVTDSYELPVDVEVLGVYPHAHYLGRQVWGRAVLPDGGTQWLLRIDRWDFNSQDMYYYEEPISLPAGSTLSMRWVYDNSSDNPLNPHDPPRRVEYGSLSTDEMSDLVFQVLPGSLEDVETLNADLGWKYEIDDVRYLARRQRLLGDALSEQGRFEVAIPRYQEALRHVSDDPRVLVGLATAFASLEDYSTAISIAERAARVTGSGDASVLAGVAAVFGMAGERELALATFGRAIDLARDSGDVALAGEIRERMRTFGGGGSDFPLSHDP